MSESRSVEIQVILCKIFLRNPQSVETKLKIRKSVGSSRPSNTVLVKKTVFFAFRSVELHMRGKLFFLFYCFLSGFQGLVGKK